MKQDRHFVLSMAGCATALLTGAAVVQAARPNVLLIITDDQNTDTVGCYGGAVQTPYIDSLAHNGIRFTNANVVHSVCSPSRYAMLTGRYYDNSRDPDFIERYPDGVASCIDNDLTVERSGSLAGMNLASVLHASGYYTAYIGKYHLTDHQLLKLPNRWEEFGLQRYPKDADPRNDASVNEKMKANHAWWCKRMKELDYDYADAIYAANVRELFNDFLDVHNVEWTTDAAVRFLRQRKDQEQPFFLTVATTYPHGPRPEIKINGKYVYSLDADVQLTGEGYVADRDLSKVLAGETRASCKRLEGQPGMSAKAPAAKWWDAAVGSVLNTLRETGAYENTLVIYISDHGLNNNGKSTLYENGIHIPLLMQWPARIAAGSAYDHVVGSTDLVPTVFDACGIQKPERYQMDGRSLLPVLNGSKDPIRDSLFIEMGYAHGIKTDDWKYIVVRYPIKIEQQISRGEKDSKWTNPGWKVPDQPYLIGHYQLAERSASSNPHYFARNQLFNLNADSEEKTNLFASMPEKSQQMKQLLRQAIQTHVPQRPFGEFNPNGNADVFQEAASAVWLPVPGPRD